LTLKNAPAFDKTGKNGSDEFGKGWLYSGFTPQMERKKGYYKQLVTANILEAKNRGEEKMYLYTEDHNVAMYERFGFGNQGHRTDNGVTENVMILDLTKFSQDDIKKFPLSAKPNSNEVDEATKSKDV
jgi:predicted acetyltransferase